jgi:phosphoribosyl 1,2-cyclic phosphodiesterase
MGSVPIYSASVVFGAGGLYSGRMIAISLQSGSNGNCIYVEAGGRRLLFDAGISGLRAQRRLETMGRDIRDVDAVIISHDHSDHVACAGVYHRKFGLPIYISPPTLAAARRSPGLGRLQDVRHFSAGGEIALGDVVVQTVPTPHDAADGVAFVVDDGRRRLGVLTDLGHVFDGLADVIASLDAVFIESNYDPDMLRNGPYPPALQERIMGDHGHISNFEAAELLSRAATERLQWACLSHLSEHNNTPELALATHREIVPAALPLVVAGRYASTDVLAL